MNGRRKPEIIRAGTFSLLHHQEAQRVLEQALSLEQAAARYESELPAALKDAYYQLVYYPAVASANVVKMQIYAGLNRLHAGRGSVLANTYADLVLESIERDKQLEQHYNTGISDGKWQGMMSSPHVGYVNWNADGWSYPEVSRVTPAKEAIMIVGVEGTEQGYTAGTAGLTPFTNLQQETYEITVSSGGAGFEYKAVRSAEWIRLDRTQGWVDTGAAIRVSVDWEKVQGRLRAILPFQVPVQS